MESSCEGIRSFRSSAVDDASGSVTDRWTKLISSALDADVLSGLSLHRKVDQTIYSRWSFSVEAKLRGKEDARSEHKIFVVYALPPIRNNNMKNQRSGHQWLSRTAVFSLLTVTNVFSVSESFVVRSPAALTRRKNSADIIQNGGAHVQLTALQMVAKSGGKIISSEEQFEEAALSKSLPRPVMVFFTAPWYVP